MTKHHEILRQFHKNLDTKVKLEESIKFIQNKLTTVKLEKTIKKWEGKLKTEETKLEDIIKQIGLDRSHAVRLGSRFHEHFKMCQYNYRDVRKGKKKAKEIFDKQMEMETEREERFKRITLTHKKYVDDIKAYLEG